ncbi:EAL domain-containing protein [Devosia albogilva]|uniref:EAL domain-containing protein n=1 Tax=Devosia albogilva TaxID=429726 RepID=A0ABW5QLI0_9HYPH
MVPALVALVLLLVGAVAIERQSASLAEERARTAVVAEVSLIRAKLEGNINANIQLVRGLVATISTEPDMDQDRFTELAANLFAEQSQLRSIAAAPDLVVQMTYPLVGNERAIGLDYRVTEAQREAVLRARDTGRLVMAGPVDLVQGGTGFIGRFPVFADDPSGDRFWGVISAVVDADRLYLDSGLFDRGLTIDISITGRDAGGAIGERFFGPDLRGDNPVVTQVLLPSGSWVMSAVPKGGWGAVDSWQWAVRLALIVGGILVLAPMVMIIRLMLERQNHIRELKAREVDLERVTRRLGLALATSRVGVWEMDTITRELVWDDRMNELYGLPADGGARSYIDWRDALHPDDRRVAEHDFAEGIRTGLYQSTFRTLHPDGTVRHVRSMGAVYTDPESNPKILGVNWDVTKDVLLNEDLRRAKALTEAHNRELEAARSRIEHNSLHDSLTGLPNRRYLDETLRRHAEHGYAGCGSMALLHIDLDRFKQINDTLGHAAGDAMLVHASAVLRANCRDTDFVARIGGDEFVVLCPAGPDDDYIAGLAERIVEQMREPVSYEGHECRFGVSIGIAVGRVLPVDAKQLLINADIALYRAKRRGRNRYEFFSDALQEDVINTKRVADEILKGLERNEFVAWFQPQFAAGTLDLVGVEALVRWQHPTEGIKAPASFMPVAEELNVVAAIDSLVLEQTLAALRHWESIGLNVPRASVNVSLRRLSDEGLIESLRRHDISPGRIAFELVESIYLDEGDGAVAWTIDQLKELGIDIEIDDFGTGYASIVSLQKLRPDRLKIDRQLVDPILTDPAQRRLLASIIDIGKAMDIAVVAEGVETLAHASILTELGVDILQGYAFARPLSPEQFETFLATQAWRAA